MNRSTAIQDVLRVSLWLEKSGHGLAHKKAEALLDELARLPDPELDYCSYCAVKHPVLPDGKMDEHTREPLPTISARIRCEGSGGPTLSAKRAQKHPRPGAAVKA